MCYSADDCTFKFVISLKLYETINSTLMNECVFEYNVDRATSTSTDDIDLLAIDLFASIVQQYESFIAFDATKIIIDKFNSPNSEEVLLALNV